MKKKNVRLLNRQGFTLIELIIVVTVILVISVVTLLNYNSYTDRQRVKQAGLTLRSDLRLAQTKATSGQKPFICDATTTLESYTITFSDCGGLGACYEILPVCTQSGTLVDTSGDVTRVFLPSSVRFQMSYAPISFFPVTGVTDLTEDRLIVLTGAGVTYSVVISTSGSISDF